MNTYSIVDVHKNADGSTTRLTLKGCTFLSLYAAYERLMDDARTYTPTVRGSHWREVVENALTWPVAVEQMPVTERRKITPRLERAA